ncbi:sigma factor G inhibitor Gin [Sutcliffiella cohnii]|uniref:Sigma factor G inhibitor Gin n=1 Tax=Sutcliffiella cohnii TaxID=33932 RepID=A0A223KWW8_9BACI|nr:MULTISPECIES: sigma factor G inhibitor Gin [Sutcliffiella]AST93956.1 sigma factor G inhibitor Gin [Sutcliffiella cohnii]MED4018441.1 sigma factor G inhibitor Gin [Sutcliffiella cohnii]WBL15159.1 sigma factor G inhibitor Gin [Sutcliffiella sp. NC1]
MNQSIRSSVGETCIICEEIKYRGLHLYTEFICLDCEKDMLNTSTDDPKYKYYVQQLRKISLPKMYS